MFDYDFLLREYIVSGQISEKLCKQTIWVRKSFLSSYMYINSDNLKKIIEID